MTGSDLYDYLHFHCWPSHPSALGPFGIAVMAETRVDRHGIDRSPSHALGANGVPAATSDGRLAAAMVACVWESWKESA